jgi:hypothetical protein
MQIEQNSFLKGMHEDAHERIYHLTCEVKKKTVSRINGESRYEAKLIYLIPQMSGELIRFYDAFLPEYVTEVNNNEFVFLNLKSGRAFRGSVNPPNKDITERHIFVMSNDEADFLEKIFFSGLKINIECVPFSEQKDFDA